MVFYTSESEKKIVYARFEKFLYIIMQNKYDAQDKKLFCYNTQKSSHDTLYSVIEFDRALAPLSNKILIESNSLLSTVFIYVLYGGKTYQFIKFEPENLLKQTDLLSGELFLPKNKTQMDKYPEKNVTLLINPHYDGYIPIQNTTVAFTIRSRNYGLKIEKLNQKSLSYSNKKGKVLLSLLDYFDGFDTSFNLDYYNNEKDEDLVEFQIKKDNKQQFLLESISNTQKVIYSLEWNGLLLLFYEQKYLLEVYDIKKEIKKLPIVFNYNELFEE